ncbi:Kinesin-like protein kif18a [Chamberlinius hualienensis]
MKVVVRVRPPNEKEINSRSVVQVLDSQSLLFDPKEETDEFYYQGCKQNFRDLAKKQNKELRYNFHNVFDEAATNEEIYNATTAEILDDLITGYNCSIFAYGPTGAGKTFTMLGNSVMPGITYMTMAGLFDLLENSGNKSFELAVTYIEIYNENLRDLLSEAKNLQIREDPRRGILVAGISVHKPKTAVDLLNMLRMGNCRRSQHSTDANAESSRSHAVFTVFVTCSGKMGGDTRGKISFIDLAGSERATAISKNKVPRLREGANINKSLLALGNCINALADVKLKGHVPYRDSKLTRLLKDSLGGNCKTIMIAAVSPSQLSYEDTYNTLKYADRAQSIKVNAKANIRTTNNTVSHYIKVVKDLQLEIEDLKKQLDLATKPVAAVPAVLTLVSPTSEISCNQDLRNDFAKFCADKRLMLTEFNEVNRKLRDFEFRMCRKEWRRSFLKSITIGSQPVPDSTIINLHQRHSIFLAKKNSIQSEVEEIEEIKNNWLNDDNLSTEDQLWMHSKWAEVEIGNLKQQNFNLKRTVNEMDQNVCVNSKLLSEIVPLFKRQYTILKTHGHATSDIVEDYQKVTNLIREYKDVTWADQFDDENATDAFANSELQLSCLADLELNPIKVDLPPSGTKCVRSLIYPTDAKNSSDDGDAMNSTFVREESSPIVPQKITGKRIRCSPIKSSILKTSTILNANKERNICNSPRNGTPKPSSLKRTALATSTNKLTEAGNHSPTAAKKIKLMAIGGSTQGNEVLRSDGSKVRSFRRAKSRAHPYKLQLPNQANKQFQENQNPLHVPSLLLPKQTITSMLRTKKPPATDRFHLFSE